MSRISVVIATYMRCEVLRETLRRLDRQTLDPDRFEVIVVDDGSPDETGAVVAAMAESVSYPLRYLVHENRGPGYTQNVGIRAAAHEHVCLIPNDVWPTSALLEEHLAGHRAHPEETVGVLGRVVQSPELPPTVLHRFWDPFRYDRFTDGSIVDGIYFLACNISVKTRFMLEHGMFKERRGAAHEDIELGYRLRRHGFRVAYNASALAEHYHEETLDGICRRAYERGRNFDLLAENVPKSFILPLYKILSTEAGVGAFLRTLPREGFVRWPLFNALTVAAFWRPVLERAESVRIARLVARGVSYRGVAGYHLRKGYRDHRRRRVRSGS